MRTFVRLTGADEERQQHSNPERAYNFEIDETLISTFQRTKISRTAV
jgi:hypothetical protein